MENYNTSAELEYNKDVLAQWAYNVNITDYNLQCQSEADSNFSIFQQDQAEQANKFNLSLISDPTMVRELIKVKTIGIVLNATDSLALSNLIGNMTGVYSTGSICSMNSTTKKVDCSVKWVLDPDLMEVLAKNRDYDTLAYVWKSWRDAVGKPIKSTYLEFVELSNKGARKGGFNDTGAFWRWPYENPDFPKTVESLWYQLLPLYEQLHAYVRRRLINKYKGKFNTSAIPAHILGNMWAQDWANLFDFLVPYPNKSSVDVTDAMKAQNYTVKHMFELSDHFFQSIGLIPMTPEFWNRSMLVKPSDGRRVVCHASAWDFYDGKDVRIKMCTKIDMESLITVHHEMGHIQYYLQYAKQRVAFREGANPGFHEAIGDTMALSVSTPTHLKAIGLLPDYVPDQEQDINYLFKTALDKIAFLPFGYLVDNWRWNVFNGNYDYDSWNQKWVDLRLRYQGIIPPVPRNNDDFDPGAKFHVPSNSPYMSYFVSFVIQFQFYENMCKAAGHQGPLYRCDFYKSKKAGELFSKMLSLGSSLPWPEAMKVMTGQPLMSAKSLLNYFKPLHTWLQKNNFGECFGWDEEWPDYVAATLPQPRCNKTVPDQHVFQSF